MFMDEPVGVDITSEGTVAVVGFRAGSIVNPEEIAAVGEQIKEFVSQNHPQRMVFDFEQVRFFSSQVLGVLLDVRAGVESYDGEVVISGIEPQLYRVFKITNLDKVFRFFPDRESAVSAPGTN